MKNQLKKVFFTGRQRIFDENGTLLPYYFSLNKFLMANGFVLVNDKYADNLIMIDHSSKKFKEWMPSSQNSAQSILIQIETDQVSPEQNETEIYNLYRAIIKVGRSKPATLQNKKFNYVNFPYIPLISANPAKDFNFSNFITYNRSSYRSWTKRPIRLSFIAMNKFANGESNLYNLRRKIVKKYGESDINVYGKYWRGLSKETILNRAGFIKNSFANHYNPQIIPILRDLFTIYPKNIFSVEDKFQILRNSKYHLIVENSTTTITEKLFDAIWAGCIPIYVGPKLKEFKLPNDLAIELNSENIINDLHQIVFSSHNQAKIFQSGQEFVTSNKFSREWSHESVFYRIAEKCLQVFRNQY